MASQWFVRSGGKVYGPLDSAKVKALVSDGKINRNTEVSQAIDGPWHPAGSVRGLFPTQSPTTSPNEGPPAIPPSVPSDPRTPSQSKRWYRRWWATFVLFPFLGFMTLGTVMQLTVPKETLDRWKAEAEERRQKRAEQVGSTTGKSPTGKNTPPGFTMGFMTGALSARDGARKPSADELDAIARRSATQNKVAENERGAWIANFKTAFWMGWRKGQ